MLDTEEENKQACLGKIIFSLSTGEKSNTRTTGEEFPAELIGSIALQYGEVIIESRAIVWRAAGPNQCVFPLPRCFGNLILCGR